MENWKERLETGEKSNWRGQQLIQIDGVNGVPAKATTSSSCFSPIYNCLHVLNIRFRKYGNKAHIYCKPRFGFIRCPNWMADSIAQKLAPYGTIATCRWASSSANDQRIHPDVYYLSQSIQREGWNRNLWTVDSPCSQNIIIRGNDTKSFWAWNFVNRIVFFITSTGIKYLCNLLMSNWYPFSRRNGCTASLFHCTRNSWRE